MGHLGGYFIRTFGLFYQVPLDSGALYPTTNVIETYVYRSLISLGDFGMSLCGGIISGFGRIFCLYWVSNAVVRKVSPDNSLFLGDNDL